MCKPRFVLGVIGRTITPCNYEKKKCWEGKVEKMLKLLIQRLILKVSFWTFNLGYQSGVACTPNVNSANQTPFKDPRDVSVWLRVGLVFTNQFY